MGWVAAALAAKHFSVLKRRNCKGVQLGKHQDALQLFTLRFSMRFSRCRLYSVCLFVRSWALPTELCNVVCRSQSGVEENRGLCAGCLHARIIATLREQSSQKS